MKQGAGGIPLRRPVAVLEVNRSDHRTPMAELLRENSVHAQEYSTDPAAWPLRIEGGALLTVAARGALSAEDADLARSWLRRFPETVTVASLNPHVCDDWTEVRTLIATFDNGPAARRGLAKRLAGPPPPPPRRRSPPPEAA
jgi:hypothetical protein